MAGGEGIHPKGERTDRQKKEIAGNALRELSQYGEAPANEWAPYIAHVKNSHTN